MKTVLALLTCASVMLGGIAYAHEGHGEHHGDAQMAKMHKMMPRYAKAQANIDVALEKGDLATVAKETDYLLSTSADLQKAKPHKRLEELRAFQSMAGNFEKEVGKTAVSASKGDLATAKASFAAAKKWCTACHAKFRD